MKKLLLALAIALPLLLIGVAVSMNGNDMAPSSAAPVAPGEQSTNQEQAANEVIIKDFDFAPEKLTVKKGTTVTWTNQDSARHDITPVNETDAFQASRLLAKGESFSMTFNSPGVYEYYCSPHPYMKASIEVIE